MKIFITFAFLFLFAFSSSAMAQEHAVYCKNVDGTALSQKCLTKHLKSAQARLNKIYVKLGETLEEGRLAELKELQKTWLTYRDAECMWEANRPEEVSLKRVNELSCMARITEDRADLLTIAYGDVTHPDTQRQLGAFPSWMNAVAKQYPDIYWNYGARLEADINCDSQDEHIMTGLQIRDGRPDVHLVVVETPLVGKAKPSLFTFPVRDEAEEAIESSICSEKIEVDIEQVVAALVDEGEEVDKSCHNSVVLTPKGCDAKTINWTGKIFDVALEKKSIEKKEIEKK